MNGEMWLVPQVILTALIMVFIPVLLGLPWVFGDLIQNSWLFCGQAYAIGFFCMLALFEMISFPAALLDISFRASMVIYSIFLIACVIFACHYLYKKRATVQNNRMTLHKEEWTILARLFMGVFLVLFFSQLYYALFYSRTYMAADGYVVYATQALEDDAFFMSDPQTGLYQIRNSTWIQRVIQSYNFFPAYLSLATGLHPATIAYTVEAVMLTIMAYGVYGSIGAVLFEKREDQYLFLLFIALFYQYGMHTIFSIVFRLLGVNYEGKAILAVIMTPLMLFQMYRIIEKGYELKTELLIFVLSVASCALSLAGIYTFVAVLGAAVLCGMMKNRSGKIVKYFFVGGVVPGIFSLIYCMFKF